MLVGSRRARRFSNPPLPSYSPTQYWLEYDTENWRRRTKTQPRMFGSHRHCERLPQCEEAIQLQWICTGLQHHYRQVWRERKPFFLTLSVVACSLGLAQRLLGYLTRRRRPLRVAVLEDDETLGPRSSTGLGEAGHVVNLAPNGKDAVLAAIAELCGAMLS